MPYLSLMRKLVRSIATTSVIVTNVYVITEVIKDGVKRYIDVVWIQLKD